MSLSRILCTAILLAPVLGACAGTPDPESAQKEADKAAVVVGSRIPTKIVPPDVSTGSGDSLDKNRRNSDISRGK